MQMYDESIIRACIRFPFAAPYALLGGEIELALAHSMKQRCLKENHRPKLPPSPEKNPGKPKVYQDNTYAKTLDPGSLVDTVSVLRAIHNGHNTMPNILEETNLSNSIVYRTVANLTQAGLVSVSERIARQPYVYSVTDLGMHYV